MTTRYELGPRHRGDGTRWIVEPPQGLAALTPLADLLFRFHEGSVTVLDEATEQAWILETGQQSTVRGVRGKVVTLRPHPDMNAVEPTTRDVEEAGATLLAALAHAGDRPPRMEPESWAAVVLHADLVALASHRVTPADHPSGSLFFLAAVTPADLLPQVHAIRGPWFLPGGDPMPGLLDRMLSGALWGHPDDATLRLLLPTQGHELADAYLNETRSRASLTRLVERALTIRGVITERQPLQLDTLAEHLRSFIHSGAELPPLSYQGCDPSPEPPALFLEVGTAAWVLSLVPSQDPDLSALHALEPAPLEGLLPAEMIDAWTADLHQPLENAPPGTAAWWCLQGVPAQALGDIRASTSPELPLLLRAISSLPGASLSLRGEAAVVEQLEAQPIPSVLDMRLVETVIAGLTSAEAPWLLLRIAHELANAHGRSPGELGFLTGPALAPRFALTIAAGTQRQSVDEDRTGHTASLRASIVAGQYSPGGHTHPQPGPWREGAYRRAPSAVVVLDLEAAEPVALGATWSWSPGGLAVDIDADEPPPPLDHGGPGPHTTVTRHGAPPLLEGWAEIALDIGGAELRILVLGRESVRPAEATRWMAQAALTDVEPRIRFDAHCDRPPWFYLEGDGNTVTWRPSRALLRRDGEVAALVVGEEAPPLSNHPLQPTQPAVVIDGVQTPLGELRRAEVPTDKGPIVVLASHATAEGERSLHRALASAALSRGGNSFHLDAPKISTPRLARALPSPSGLPSKLFWATAGAIVGAGITSVLWRSFLPEPDPDRAQEEQLLTMFTSMQWPAWEGHDLPPLEDRQLSRCTAYGNLQFIYQGKAWTAPCGAYKDLDDELPRRVSRGSICVDAYHDCRHIETLKPSEVPVRWCDEVEGNLMAYSQGTSEEDRYLFETIQGGRGAGPCPRQPILSEDFLIDVVKSRNPVRP